MEDATLMPEKYFDHNATTPLSEAAREAWIQANEEFWHNPSSLYREAGAAKRHLEDAREFLADLLGADPERIVFTASATEANNAVMAYARAHANGGGGVIISSVEHPSVTAPALREFGSERVKEFPVESHGAIDLERAGSLIDACKEPPGLVSVMAANNESGVLQPWRKVAESCQEREILFHCDAAQWIGKLPARRMAESAGFLTGCAHKFGGPKGTGFLVIPEKAVENFRSLVGGPQERGHRGGTEDLPGILSMVAALTEKPDDELREISAIRSPQRDEFEQNLTNALPGVRLLGVDSGSERLWNTSLFVLPRHQNLKWLTRLTARGFSVSTGSACSAGRGNPSHVLEAMGLSYEEMGRVLRVSGGGNTGSEDWSALLEALRAVLEELDSGRRTTVGGALG